MIEAMHGVWNCYQWTDGWTDGRVLEPLETSMDVFSFFLAQ
jgi:hypothetical protein